MTSLLAPHTRTTDTEPAKGAPLLMSTSSSRTASLVTPGRWIVDPARSRAEFRVKHTWGLATVVGSLDATEGLLEIDAERRLHMRLVLDATSVRSQNRMRDKDLRSDRFFDVEHHPTVEFVSSSATLVEDEGMQVQVTGQLRAGGRSVVITPQTTLRPDGEELVVDATAVVDQRDLGMTHSPLGMVRTPSRLHVSARLHRFD